MRGKFLTSLKLCHFHAGPSIKGCFCSAFQSNLFTPDTLSPLFTFYFSDSLYVLKNNSKAKTPLSIHYTLSIFWLRNEKTKQ